MRGIGNGVLLDTNVVIHHFRQSGEITETLFKSEILYLPTIALGELYHGAYKSNNVTRNLKLLSEFLPLVVVLSVDYSTARYYGQIKSTLSNAGTPIPENDIWIAALTLEHGLTLLTRDKHFDLVADLTVSYF